MIYHRRWFRNARPVTFIVLPRAYVYAFFPPFQKLKKNTRLCVHVGRRERGEEEGGEETGSGRNEIGEHRTSLRETFRSNVVLGLTRDCHERDQDLSAKESSICVRNG